MKQFYPLLKSENQFQLSGILCLVFLTLCFSCEKRANNEVELCIQAVDPKIIEGPVHQIHKTSNNILWFALDYGVNAWDGKKWKLFSEENGFLSENHTQCLGEFEGMLMIGTAGDGVNRLYLSGIDGISGASSFDTQWTEIASATIECMLIDAPNAQWFGTASGVSIHTGEQSRTGWKQLTMAQGLPSDSITSLMKTNNNEFLIGTTNGLSVVKGDSVQNIGFEGESIACLEQDPEENIWVATSKGLYYFPQGNLYTTPLEFEYLSDILVKTLFFDSDEIFWIGTNNGIYAYQRGKQVFTDEFSPLMDLCIFDIFQTGDTIWVAAEDKAYQLIRKK